MIEGATIEPTGRELREPTGRLLELSDGSATYTAIEVDASYADHPALNVGIELIDSFMAHPMVIGLAELLDRTQQPMRFTYATGQVWTIRELLRQHRDIGKAMGVRAGVELAYLAWQILQEASETGAPEGCYSHGNLNPWRIALRRDGTVQVLGFGIPAVDWLSHLDNPKRIVDADTVRYAPPERLTDSPEDGAADAFSLATIVWEVMTGEPLLADHNPNTLRERIATGEATSLLSKRTKGIPKAVSDVLARMTIFDPDTRLSGRELNRELKELLSLKLTGSSLAEIMKRVRGSKPSKARKRKAAQKVDTGRFTPEQLAEHLDSEADGTGDEPESRWAKIDQEAPADTPEDDKPKRRRRRTATAEAEPPPEEESKPKRRRRRTAAADEEASEAKAEAPADKPKRRRRKAASTSEASEPSAEQAETPKRRRRRNAASSEDPAADAAPAEPAPKRRRRTSAASTDAPAEPSEAKAAEADDPPKPRRRRRTAKAEEPAADSPVPEAKADAPEEAPRRRRRRKAAESDTKTSAPEPEAESEAPSPKRRRRRRTES